MLVFFQLEIVSIFSSFLFIVDIIFVINQQRSDQIDTVRISDTYLAYNYTEYLSIVISRVPYVFAKD